jgi:hypothetical protein
MRLPDEPIETLNTEETAWRLLEPWGMTPDTATLERHAVYRFMARYAEQWRRGRVLLAGDAAHLMPPFAGEGMCNGLRDAINLSWKLDLILSGKASDGLLDSYQTERLDHVRQWINFSAALGEVICVLDEEQATERDRRMLAGEADPMRVLPAAPPQRLGDGLFLQQAQAGVHFIQAPVEQYDEAGLFDEVVGVGFALIGVNEEALEPITEAQRTGFSHVGGRIRYLSSDPDPGEESFRDPTGAYRAWLEENDAVAVLVRPDFYVYGVAAQAGEVPTLVESLLDDLELRSDGVADVVSL